MADQARPPQAVLVASRIRKSYGGQAILDGIELALPAGRVVAISGPNGAGKSTLLGCLAGTLRHAGEVRLGAERMGGATRGRVAYLPQRVRMPPSASVGDVLALFRALAGGQPDRVAPHESFVPSAERQVGRMSGGQAQRVALAAVLSGSPDVILLDEPLANLDDEAREAALELVRVHAAGGALVLIATPTIGDLLGTVEQVVQIEAGRITFSGSPAEYLGRLEMSIWVRSNGTVGDAQLRELGGVVRLRRQGEWSELLCREDDVARVVAELAARGVEHERIRLSVRAGRLSAALPGRERRRA